MGNWSYRIREIWQLHKREIKKYGLCAWALIIGIWTRTYALAWVGLGAAIIMYAYDRWGRPWAERGRIIMGGKKTDKDAS
jgi:hypothetical protein